MKIAFTFLCLAFLGSAVPAFAQKTTVPQPLAAPGESTEPPRPRGAPVAVVQAQELPRAGGVLIFGDGDTARDLARHLIRAGTKVTIVLPRSDKDLSAAGITVASVDLHNPDAVKEMFRAAPVRAVVSIQEGSAYLDNNRAIADSMARANLPRLIMTSSVGASDSADGLPWYVRLLTKFGYLNLSDKTQAEAYVKNATLDYTIVRVAGVSGGAASTQGILTEDENQQSQIARADLVALIARAIDDDTLVDKTVTAFDPTRTGFLAFF